MATETLERRFAAIGARVKVVKRPPQSSHTRRRRMAWFSSVGRLSLTWVVSPLQ